MTAIALDERALCEALRNGDERAFETLFAAYHAPLRRLAMSYVHSAAVADEIVQETWLGVIRGIGRFEGRSSLKTWIFRILTNTAKTRAIRESRTVPLSSLQSGADGESVDPDRFLDERSRWPGHWAAPPARWEEVPEAHLFGIETLEVVDEAIDQLPAAQRQVIILRDIEGWEAEEVCEVLQITEVNQRVLLHRARSKVRQALEDHLSA